MNNDFIQGKWKEIKGDLRKAWGNVTDDEWEKTKGDATAIAGVLQQKYGMAKEEASQKVSAVMDKYLSSTREDLDKPERPH
ncbi:CsbD family protein [Bdellovibrio sp. NC01]|uniref:CsbD family protein n=1 Tax=Bdellovibrio sp. NC01 TaxID=2220073 RepID=UPI00115881C9|nr:CsbD family protein [Bdellovibrio sp. NC01]QDK36300.1 CsbD family protein [Bdellovibrio sp. NC01]